MPELNSVPDLIGSDSVESQTPDASDTRTALVPIELLTVSNFTDESTESGHDCGVPAASSSGGYKSDTSRFRATAPVIAGITFGTILFDPNAPSALGVMTGAGLCAAAGMLTWFYLLPTDIASRRSHPSLRQIMRLNRLLGWTLIGWFVAYRWALSGSAPATPQEKEPQE
jgi:hypothetical protein